MENIFPIRNLKDSSVKELLNNIRKEDVCKVVAIVAVFHMFKLSLECVKVIALSKA